MKYKPLPPLSRIKELLDFDPESGRWTWRVSMGSSARAGQEAGCFSRGYRVIRIDRVLYFAHRLAWLWMSGEEPATGIDHVRGKRDQNAAGEIRPATQSQNNANARIGTNNRSGFKGVAVHRETGKWRARIKKDGRELHLGLFSSLDDARAAYENAARRLFGEFARVA